MRVFFDKPYELSSPGSRTTFAPGRFYQVDDEALAQQVVQAGIGRTEEQVAADAGLPEKPAAAAEDSPHDGA